MRRLGASLAPHLMKVAGLFISWGRRRRPALEETIMAKGQKRSTREVKKPKADKKKPATISSPFTEPPSKKKPPSA
jgi:hypothetical protein